MKAVLNLGWKNYIMDPDKAVAVLQMLEGAEIYEETWHHESKNKTHHVYEQEAGSQTLNLIPDSLYRMAKLAGKPDGKAGWQA